MNNITNKKPKCVCCNRERITGHFEDEHGSKDGIKWICKACFEEWTCLMAGQFLPKDHFPTLKKIYRAWQIYAKKHDSGEPYWDCGYFHLENPKKLEPYQTERIQIQMDIMFN